MALRSLADGRLFGAVHGDGPPRILALHGWGRSHRDFSPALDGLPAVAVDLPGFGASPAPDEPLGAHGYARLIAPLLEEFETPPVIVGHSFGGRIAVALEADAPGTFASMLLTGVPLLRTSTAASPPLGYRLVKLANRIGLVSDERLERERRSRGSADYRAATGVMRDVLVTAVNESYEDELARLALPVTLLWGGEDAEVPLAVASAAASILGDRANLIVVEGGGHLLPVTEPARLRTELEAML